MKKFGKKSMIFDGSSDYTTIPDTSDFEFGKGNFLIEIHIPPKFSKRTVRKKKRSKKK